MKKLWLLCSMIPMMSYAATDQEIFQITASVSNNPIFKNNLDKCPADTSPKKPFEDTQNYTEAFEICSEDAKGCYQRCTENHAYACYVSAQIVQESNQYVAAEQLFQRACELGVPSACTNRAAGALNFLDKISLDQKQCITRTFEKSCAWDDPWGCTMYAKQIIEADQSERSYKRALEVLKKSCKYGPKDEACSYGMDLKQDILNSLGSK